ncbi:glycoside hydrolase family 26 protein [Pontibacter sp. XAAS-A31]|nr:glycoside hydrolase family 26 protein [Pontibacter harenae]
MVWWGAKGAELLKELWHLIYYRMVYNYDLTNLTKVWTMVPNDDAWYPGDEYVDIIGRDNYNDGDHTSHVLEFNELNSRYGGMKMQALSN